jgi:hypothetical protein
LIQTFVKSAALKPCRERISTKNCNFAASNRNNDDTSGKNVDQLIEFDIANAMFDSYNLDQSSINFNKRATGPGSVAAGSFTWDN